MKKIQLLVLLYIFSTAFILRGQTLIESFDAVSTDTTYATLLESGSTAAFADVTTDKVEGAASFKFHAKLGSVHSYGTYVQRQKLYPDGTYLNLSTYDSLSLWIKVTQAPLYTASFVFRIHIADRPAPGDNNEEYIYEHATIIDVVSGWAHLKIPLVEREIDSALPDSTGFILFPSAWSRNPATQENNRVLDWDKIVAFNIAAVSLTDQVDSIEFLLDKFEMTGVKEIPLVVFNGKAVPSALSGFAWGQSSLSVEEGAGTSPQKNAIKWIQGDEWGNGWTGIGWNIAPPHNLANAWATDSIKFWMKTETWMDTIDIAFETSSAKVGILFVPKGLNQWYRYSFPLSSATPMEGTTGFDPSAISTFGIMAGHPGFPNGTGVAGSVLWFDDVWTGSPDFDVIAPVPPSGLAAIPGTYINLITWQDVPGEEGEHYNIYYSRNPITDVSQAEVAALKIEESKQTYNHILRAPETDQDVSYYYAITCTDAEGNTSEIASIGPVINTAQGVVTISLSAPAFTADGDLGEWANVHPLHIAPSGGGVVITNFTIDGDADLSADAYLAVDNTYLYVAFDVEDDVISHVNSTTYENDAPDLYIGLYNYHGIPHTGYKRGAQPDYHFRFAFDRALVDGISGGDSLLVPGENYYWGEKFPTGYIVEARIPLTLLHDKFGDNTFIPVDGYRIPFDFAINDNDGNDLNNPPNGVPDREGLMYHYAADGQDRGYQDVSSWTYTWVGTAWLGVDDENPGSLYTYSLSQNYPNPFNPSTQITYTLEKPGLVSIKVYDILGRYITALVNDQQNAGLHSVNFNASGLSSGIYFYQLTSGSFTSSRKMILMK